MRETRHNDILIVVCNIFDILPFCRQSSWGAGVSRPRSSLIIKNLTRQSFSQVTWFHARLNRLVLQGVMVIAYTVDSLVPSFTEPM